MFASIRAQRSRRAKGGLEDRVGNSIVTGGDSSGNYNGDQNPRHLAGWQNAIAIIPDDAVDVFP
jgi:hypothetical protein